MVKALLCLVASVTARETLYDRVHSPPTWNQVARADSNHNVQFTVALKQTNLDKLDEQFWKVSDPEHSEWQNFMSIEEIDNMVAPNPEHYRDVMDWLVKGLEGAVIEGAGDHIKVRATAKQVEALFDTEMHLFSHDNGHMIARTMGKHSVPDEVRGAVDFVAGLTEFPMPRSSGVKARKPDANAVVAAVIPQSLKKMYSIPSTAESSISQGVAEFQGDESYNKQDLNTFFSQLNIPSEVVADTVGPYSGSYPDGEATLDTQYLMGVGENEVDWYWTSTGWMYDWSSKFFSSAEVPDSVSISWGWAEDGQCSGGIDGDVCSTVGIDSSQYVARVNTEFQKIGLRGVSLMAASGDSGANGRTDNQCTGSVLHASFPASSPYITAVGATALQDPVFDLATTPKACTALGPPYKCASGGTEVAVSFEDSGFTSGGGFSTYTPMPSYQADAVNAYLASDVALPPSSYFNSSNRGYPDVAAMGSNYAIYMSVGGGWVTESGTSASSPTFTAVAGYLNAASQKSSGKPLGFLNPLLYKMYAESPEAFTDVTVGDNKCTEYGCYSTCNGYECAKGWDPVTGLGTPVTDKMLTYVESLMSSKSVSV